jgi:D-alanine-D-alanine ligase
MRVLLLVDRWAYEADDPECELLRGVPADDNCHVASALRKNGHDVQVLPFDPGIDDMLARIRAARPDVVFNSTDQLGGDRNATSRLVGLLELMGLPYTGSDPLGLSLTTDKELCKRLLRQHGVPVPDFFTLGPGDEPPRELSFPLFVKPRFGAGKECISNGSLVASRGALLRRARLVHRVAGQPALCERYIDREMTVAVLEEAQGLRVFPIREMVFERRSRAAPRFATASVLNDADYRKQWGVRMIDAKLPKAQAAAIAELARLAFRALSLRGYARLDLRLAANDAVCHVIEVNANPALRPATGSFLAPWGGMTYEQLIQAVLDRATTGKFAKRWGGSTRGRG